MMSWLLRSLPVSLTLRLNSAWATLCEEVYDWTVLRPLLFCGGGARFDFLRFKEMFREVCEAWSYAPNTMRHSSELFGCGRVSASSSSSWSLARVQVRFAQFWLRVSDASAGARDDSDGDGDDDGSSNSSVEERDERVMQLLKCLRDKVFRFDKKRAGAEEAASVPLGVGAADDGADARVVLVGVAADVDAASSISGTADRVVSDAVDPAAFAPYRSLLQRRMLPAIARVAGFLPSVSVAMVRLGAADRCRPKWWLCVDAQGLCSDEDMVLRVKSPRPRTIEQQGVMTRAQYRATVAAAEAGEHGPPFSAYPYMASPLSVRVNVRWDVRRNRLFLRFMRVRDVNEGEIDNNSDSSNSNGEN